MLAQEKLAQKLNAEFASLSLEQRLASIADRFPAAVLTSSLGPEDQAITHAIAENSLAIQIVTLQTGRLFGETLALIDETRKRYAMEIEEFHPEPAAVEAYVTRNGRDGFYESIEARHACCDIRKVEPLRRALAGRGAWISGLRREQSPDRGNVAFAEWSADYRLMKFNPLADWSSVDLHSTIERHGIPVNALHKRGYASIGCEPCTRAVKPGEPERAGRWWWEQDQARECGLHVVRDQSTPTQDRPYAVAEAVFDD